MDRNIRRIDSNNFVGFTTIGFLPTFGINLLQAWPSITGMAGAAVAADMR